jgi:class 3 adenylate cyclase
VSVGDQPRIDVRVSDAEREHAVALLQGHHAAGRLSLDEFSERVDEAYRARTTSDLDHALRELPFDQQPRPARRRSWWRVRGLPGWWLRVNGICTTIWLISAIGGGAYYFWPAWVMFGTGIPVLMSTGHGRRHHHPRPDRASTPAQSPPDLSTRTGRVVSSVLFIDVVESTARAAASGDAEWNRLLSDYERQVREEVTRHGGHEVFTKGDEVVAAFATPAAAVRSGQDIRTRAQQLGLEVRAGVHAGEVDQQGREMRGLAMHIGQRVCAAAEPGQILVSSTVRDLLAGSSLAFTDAGERELKGLPGPWRLFAVTG